MWKYYMEKSNENMLVSKQLYDNKNYGLSSFHAQQGLELAIKSFCLKHKINERFTKPSIFKTHLPSNILLEEFFKYIIDLYNKGSGRHKNRDVELLFNETIQIIEGLLKILKDMSDTRKSNQIWCYSLKIPTESIITDKLKEISNKQINTQTSLFDVDGFRQKLIKHINDKTKYIKGSDEFERNKNKCNKKLIKHGFHDNFLDSFLTNNSNDWKYYLKSFINKEGSIKTFDIILKHFYCQKSFNFNINKKDDQDFNIMSKLIWCSLISSSIILLFPHEQIGRYPTFICNKISDGWYGEKCDILLKLINDCKISVKRIQEMCND